MNTSDGGARGRKIDRRRWRMKGDFSSGSNLAFADQAPLGRGKAKALVATVRRRTCAARESLLLRQKNRNFDTKGLRFLFFCGIIFTEVIKYVV